MGANRPLKIAIDLTAASWLGGLYYLRNLILALSGLPEHERPELVGVEPWQHQGEFASLLPLAGSLPRDVDVIFPNLGVREKTSAARIAWIPDLQHIILPENFSRLERLHRHVAILRSAYPARTVVVSSHVANEHVQRFYRRLGARLRVLHFTTSVPDVSESPVESGIFERYQLEGTFVFLPSQFWTHKNHLTAFEALNQLDVQLVCTGETSDYRAPRHFAELNDRLKRSGLANRVRILGVVPRSDYFQLLRAARVVLQPSLFEGWSSVVEDARAFGKAMVLSDIEVHREQDPAGARYFPATHADGLAEAIRAALASGDPVPEARALAAQADRVAAYARAFCAIAHDATAGV